MQTTYLDWPGLRRHQTTAKYFLCLDVACLLQLRPLTNEGLLHYFQLLQNFILLATVNYYRHTFGVSKSSAAPISAWFRLSCAAFVVVNAEFVASSWHRRE